MADQSERGEYSSDGYSCGVLNAGPPADELDEFSEHKMLAFNAAHVRLVFKGLKKTLLRIADIFSRLH